MNLDSSKCNNGETAKSQNITKIYIRKKLQLKLKRYKL